MADTSAMAIKKLVVGHRYRMTHDGLVEWAEEARRMLGEIAQEREQEEADDAASLDQLEDVALPSEAVTMAIVPEEQFARMRSFIEHVAQTFKGKLLGDDALAALTHPQKDALND